MSDQQLPPPGPWNAGGPPPPPAPPWSGNQAPSEPVPAKKRNWKKIGLIAAAVFVGLMVISAIAGDPEKDDDQKVATEAVTTTLPSTTTEKATATTQQPTTTKAPATTAAPPATAPPTTAPPATDPPGPTLTPSQKQAVGAAEGYLDFSSFSRQGLIDQLSSEYGDQFSVEDATAAVESLTVDWNAQAAKAAQGYLDFSSFSCQGLIDQLASEYGDQYTVDQATFGANQTGIC